MHLWYIKWNVFGSNHFHFFVQCVCREALSWYPEYVKPWKAAKLLQISQIHLENLQSEILISASGVCLCASCGSGRPPQWRQVYQNVTTGEGNVCSVLLHDILTFKRSSPGVVHFIKWPWLADKWSSDVKEEKKSHQSVYGVWQTCTLRNKV